MASLEISFLPALLPFLSLLEKDQTVTVLVYVERRGWAGDCSYPAALISRDQRGRQSRRVNKLLRLLTPGSKENPVSCLWFGRRISPLMGGEDRMPNQGFGY